MPLLDALAVVGEDVAPEAVADTVADTAASTIPEALSSTFASDAFTLPEAGTSAVSSSIPGAVSPVVTGETVNGINAANAAGGSAATTAGANSGIGNVAGSINPITGAPMTADEIAGEGSVATGGNGIMGGGLPPPSALANGFNSALSWMGEHPIMTGLGIMAGANALGLNKPTTINPNNLPGNTQMNTGYYKLNPATFQPTRMPTATNPVKPTYTDYLQNPYNYQGYASGGITSLKSGGSADYDDAMQQQKVLNQYEQMMTGQQGMGNNYAQMMTGQGGSAAQQATPSWVTNGGVNTDTDPNTKNLSPLEAAKYRLAQAYAQSGAPTSAGMGINSAASNYGQVNTNPAMVQAAMAQQQQAVQGSAQGGIMGYAAGGVPQYNLGGYANGGNPRLLQGPGDGMSDNIPATIADKQPARLADGEFVVPADVVSHLGNGSTDAGAKKLHGMMDKVRMARTGKKKQAPAVKPDKFIPE